MLNFAPLEIPTKRVKQNLIKESSNGQVARIKFIRGFTLSKELFSMQDYLEIFSFIYKEIKCPMQRDKDLRCTQIRPTQDFGKEWGLCQKMRSADFIKKMRSADFSPQYIMQTEACTPARQTESLHFKIWTIFSLTFCLFALLCHSTRADVVDKVVAVVNDQVVTQAEVEQALGPLRQQYKAIYNERALELKLEEARKKVIERLIEDKLVLEEALRMGVKVDEYELDKRMEEVKSRFSSEEEFQEALEQQGLRLVDLRKKYRNQIMIKEVTRMMMKDKVLVTPSQVSEYYQAHGDDFKVPLGLKVSQILIKTSQGPEDILQARKAAEELVGVLRTGADFSKMAKMYSQGPNVERGGDMGYVEKGQLIGELDEAIFSLKEGEISDPVQTKVGFHIFKVEARRPERIKPLDEVRAQIEEILLPQQMEKVIEEWLSELKKNAYISIK